MPLYWNVPLRECWVAGSVFICVCTSAVLCVYMEPYEDLLCICVGWGTALCEHVHARVRRFCRLWPALSDKWSPFSNRPNYSLTSEGEQWLRGHCHISVPAQQKSGYFPAAPGLLIQHVLNRNEQNFSSTGCQICCYWLVSLCNGSKLQSSHSLGMSFSG